MRASRISRYKRSEQQAASYPYRIERFNCDMHWRLTVADVLFDFWPATGKYREPIPDGGIQGVAADFNDFLTRATQAVAARREVTV